MQRIFSVFFTVGIALAPVIVQSTRQSAWGQVQNTHTKEEANRLLKQAQEQIQQNQLQQAIETFQQVLAIARQLQDRKLEAEALFWIGEVYREIGQPQKALEYFNQSLPISREVRDRNAEATTLNNIGAVYTEICLKKKSYD